MLWGIKNNERIRATPKEKAECELCKGELIAKCGEIKIWHWSHKSNKECDNWWEPESEWHIKWKEEFPTDQQEVTIGKHRADIKTRTGTIIELQKSSISLKDVRERERFYGDKLIWLLDGETLFKGLEFRKKEREFITFRLKHPSKIWWYARNLIFIHLNYHSLFLIKKIYHNIPCGGYGILYEIKDFLKIYGDIYGETKNIL